jgi:RNA polymerase sigma-70 factor (ECF subfamily)
MSTTVTVSEPSSDDAQELDRWFREYCVLVYRTACAITGSPEDAEDVLQTIFLRLTRRSVPLNIRTNPKGYFYRAAVNLSLNTIRLKQREVLTAEFGSIPGVIHTDTAHEQNALDDELVKTLAKLSLRTVEILTLRYVHHYTEPEIAKLLKVSRSTVAVTLFRGRRRLRKLLSRSAFGKRRGDLRSRHTSIRGATCIR